MKAATKTKAKTGKWLLLNPRTFHKVWFIKPARGSIVIHWFTGYKQKATAQDARAIWHGLGVMGFRQVI